MELKTGQIVFSRKGRDVTKVYVVAGFNENRVLLADGEKWPLVHPKPKNPQHINPTKTILTPAETQSDPMLKAAIKTYIAQHGLKQQGG